MDLILQVHIRKQQPDIMKNEFVLLVVDDDHEDLEIFCEAMKLINPEIKCLMARDGKEALTLLRQLPELPKIIFLDNNMPQMNGRKCLTHIKDDPHLKEIPVIMYSTFFSSQDVEDFKNSGAAVLKKQIDFSDIVKHLSAALGNFYPTLVSR